MAAKKRGFASSGWPAPSDGLVSEEEASAAAVKHRHVASLGRGDAGMRWRGGFTCGTCGAYMPFREDPQADQDTDWATEILVVSSGF